MNLRTYALIMLCAFSDIAYGAKTYYVSYALPEFITSGLVTKRNELTQNVDEFLSNVNWVQKTNMEGLIAYFMPTMQAEQLTQVEAMLDEFAKKTAPFSIKDKSLSYSFVSEVYRPVSYMGMSFAQYAFFTDPVLTIFSKQINDMFLAKGIGLKLPEGQSNSVKLFYTPAVYKSEDIIKKATELFKGVFATKESTLTIDKLLLKAYDDSTRKAEVYKTYALVGGAPVVTPPTGGGTEGTSDKQPEGDAVPVDNQTGYALTFELPNNLAVEIAKTWNQSQARLTISKAMNNVDLSIRADEMQAILKTFPSFSSLPSIDNEVVAKYPEEIVVPDQAVFFKYELRDQNYPFGAQYAAVYELSMNADNIGVIMPDVKIYASKNTDNINLFQDNKPLYGGQLQTSFTISKIVLRKYNKGALGSAIKTYTLPKKIVPPPVVATDDELKNEAINLITEVEALVTLVK